MNEFISIASFGLGASTLVFLYNMIWSWKHGPKPAATRGMRWALEWQVSSPPPIFNFTRSRRSSAARTSTASPAPATRSSPHTARAPVGTD